MTNCILPFKDCPYRKEGWCEDPLTNSGNSDAACFKITGKKKMIRKSILSTPSYIHVPLEIETSRYIDNWGVKHLVIFVGEKRVCELAWHADAWKLGDQKMGTNELDAVEAALKYFKYRRRGDK